MTMNKQTPASALKIAPMPRAERMRYIRELEAQFTSHVMKEPMIRDQEFEAYTAQYNYLRQALLGAYKLVTTDLKAEEAVCAAYFAARKNARRPQFA
jgi:hypothetical protein